MITKQDIDANKPVIVKWDKALLNTNGQVTEGVLAGQAEEFITRIEEESELLSELRYLEMDGETLDIQGLFIYIGYTPSTSYLKSLDIDIENGYIKTDINHETSIKGIYAIGDIVPKKYYQILSAMNEGMETSLNIAAKLN